MATMLPLTPQQKAALVVVSGLPAPPGVAGVIVQKYDRDAARSITDSLDVVRGHARDRALAAVRAGADLLLFTSGADAARAVRALVPLARRGELDVHVARVLRFRSSVD